MLFTSPPRSRFLTRVCLAALVAAIGAGCAGTGEWTPEGREITRLVFTRDGGKVIDVESEAAIRAAIATKEGGKFTRAQVEADRQALAARRWGERSEAIPAVDGARPQEEGNETLAVTWKLFGALTGPEADVGPWSPEGRPVTRLTFVRPGDEPLPALTEEAIRKALLTRVGERYAERHVARDRATLVELRYGARSDVVAEADAAGAATGRRGVALTWWLYGEVTGPGPTDVFRDPVTGAVASWPVTDGGTVSGVVAWSGEALDPPPAPADCDSRAEAPLLVVNGGRVEGAVVTLTAVAPTPAPPRGEARGVDLAAVACRFTPRVVAVGVGSLVVFHNDDVTPYRLTSADMGATVTVEARSTARLTVDRPGAFRFVDERHPWHWAWLFVHDSPLAAVSDAQGRFLLRGVPEGTYEIRVWHADLRVKRPEPSRVRVAADQPQTKEFVLKPR